MILRLANIGLFLAITACLTINAQQTQIVSSDLTSQGVALYEKGDLDGAIKILREAAAEKTNSRALHYLGLALIGQGNRSEASEALSNALALRSQSFREAFKRAPDEVRDTELDRLRLLLNEEIETRKKHIKILTNEEPPGLQQALLEASQIQAACFEEKTKSVAGHLILKKKDLGIKKVKITYKPEPDFKSAKGTGMVVLRAVFMADGSVKHIKLVSGLDELANEAIKAVSRIKFEPASICGKRIVSFLQIEYAFRF